MPDSGFEDASRALLGSLFLIGSMICFVYICYKYAVCQENEKAKNMTSLNPSRMRYTHPAVVQVKDPPFKMEV